MGCPLLIASSQFCVFISWGEYLVASDIKCFHICSCTVLYVHCVVLIHIIMCVM